MLLHVIETARPVDLACIRASLDRTVENVRHPPVVFLHYVYNARRTNHARVEGLASGGRIKTSAIQTDPCAGLSVRMEPAQVTVVVIEAVHSTAIRAYSLAV